MVELRGWRFSLGYPLPPSRNLVWEVGFGGGRRFALSSRTRGCPYPQGWSLDHQGVRRLAYEARITGETIEVRWPIRWDEAYRGGLTRAGRRREM